MKTKKRIDNFCENKMTKLNLLSILGGGDDTNPVLPGIITGLNNGNPTNGPIIIPFVIKAGVLVPTEFGG